MLWLPLYSQHQQINSIQNSIKISPLNFHRLKSHVHKHFLAQSSTESRACALSRVLERFIWGIIQARLKHGWEDVSLCLIAAIKAEVTRSSGVARINWPDKASLNSGIKIKWMESGRKESAYWNGLRLGEVIWGLLKWR